MLNLEKSFNFDELPAAFFKDNPNSKELRSQLVKQTINITESGQNELDSIFFSDDNINNINKKLILTVYKKSNNLYKIHPQTKESLLIVMRYVYIEHARNLPFKIEKQINSLNCTVVGEILPNIFTNITQKIEYLKSLDRDRELLPLPINVNNTNLLPPISGLFF
jgi:hypothetical protein